MIELFKSKRVWGGAAVLAVLSFLVAFGLNTALDGFLQLPEGAELPGQAMVASVEDGGSSSSRRSSSRPRSSTTYKKPVMERNIFDSTSLNVQSEAVDEEVGGKTDLRVTLIATMVASPEQYSSALIADDGRESTALAYNIGQTLLGEAEIIGIEQKRVILRRSNGEVEYLAMDEEGAPAPKKRGGKKTDDDEEEDGITKDGETIVVERAVVDEALANVDQLASKIRVVPHKGADGEIDGYRLSAIRRGSLFDKLGIKNGDVVHGVNGMPLTSADGAFGAFQTLQSESNFTFDVTRRGQRSEHKYEIR